MSTSSVVLACAVAFALCFAGWAALCMAMDRHHAQLTGLDGQSRSNRWAWRVSGAAVLCASLWHCMTAWGPTIGFVAWWGFLSAGAIALVVTLTYRFSHRPKKKRRQAPLFQSGDNDQAARQKM